MIEIITLIIIVLSVALAVDYWRQVKLYKMQQELEETRKMLEQINDCSKSLQSIVDEREEARRHLR